MVQKLEAMLQVVQPGELIQVLVLVELEIAETSVVLLVLL